jgi:putative DNA primase/helicase
MKNYAKLAFNCNELPKDFDHSNAYFRRLLIIPFRVTIPEHKQDKTLAGKIIQKELAGVFNWIIDGLKRLLKTEKFTESQTVTDTLETYKRESDSVACFIAENSYTPSQYEVGATNYFLLRDLYPNYRSFCSDDGASALKKSNFKRRLEANGFELKEMNNGIRVYYKIDAKENS